MRQQLRVIAIAASKGGSGKTTLATALAVRAIKDRAKVGIIDLDPQRSATRWWELRGRPNNPQLIKVGKHEILQDAITRARKLALDWVFVDCPPAFVSVMGEAVGTADLVVVPVRPSPLDVEAVDPVVELARAVKTPLVFVLNQTTRRSKLARGAAMYLAHDGEVLEASLSLNDGYISAMMHGKTGAEKDAAGLLAEEVNGVWREVKKRALAPVAPPRPRKIGGVHGRR